MAATQRPNREAFVAYWQGYDDTSWRKLLPYLVYLGPLALYAFVVRWFDPEVELTLLACVLALAYVFIFPCVWIRSIHKRYARFIRCPSCGDWFASDPSGEYRGPNPKFRGVIETGRCVTCGEPILSDCEGVAQQGGSSVPGSNAL